MDELMIWVIPIVASTFRMATPLLFTSLGGLMSERSGVINIALEGLMLMGAFGGAVFAHYFQNPFIGGVGAIASGVAFAALYGLFVIEFESDQIVAGTAMNLLAAGLPPFLMKILFDVTTSTPQLSLDARFQTFPLYAVWVVVLAIWYWYRYTPAGLRVRFVGEKPEAVDAAGISVKRLRWRCILMSGALAGFGGATLSIYLASAYSKNMSAGRGFMALAALIFGKWKPIPTAFACLLFGLTDALQIRLQGVRFFDDFSIPVQFIQIIPYVVTIIVLAGFVGRSRPPSALGRSFS